MPSNNPAKLATNNPKAFSLTNTQLAGNSRLGVNNVTSFPNISNPKSLGQPSANGFTDLPNNPKYTPYKGSTTPDPIINETQAVTTTASEVGSGFKAVGKGLGILSLFAIPSVVQDFSQAVGFLANLPQISKNYSEKERLDALIKARENQAKASLNARIDTPIPQVITATVWRVNGDGLDCNGGGIYPNSHYNASIIQLSNEPAPQLVDSPHPSCGQYNTKNIRYPDGSIFAIHLHPSATLAVEGQNSVPFVFPNSGANTSPPANEWIYGEVPVTVSGNAAAILDDVETKAKAAFPKIKTKPNSGSPDPKNDVKTNNPPIKSVSTPKTANSNNSPSFPTVSPSSSPKTVNNTSGFKTIGTTQTSETYTNGNQTAPNVTTKPVSTPVKTQPPVNSNSPNIDLGSISASLIGLGLSVGAIATAVNYVKGLNEQINSQTSNASQQANVSEGVCNSMQEGQCGFNGVKNAATQATNPIKDIAVNNGNLLATLLSLLNTIWTFLQDKVGKVLELLNNQVVDRAIHLTNMALNFHSAMMISNNLGKSLAGIIDTVFGIVGIQFTDDKGQKKSATTIFNNGTQAFIKSIIGADNYTELVLENKLANRIYQTGINAINKSTRLFHQQAKVIQKVGTDVSDIGNGLLDSGTVAATSYPKMSRSPAANMPSETYSAVNSPLGEIADGIKSLNAITKQVLTTKKSIDAIQKDFTKIGDLTNSESNARKAIRTAALAEVKRKTNFSNVQITAIKAKSKP